MTRKHKTAKLHPEFPLFLHATGSGRRRFTASPATTASSLTPLLRSISTCAKACRPAGNHPATVNEFLNASRVLDRVVDQIGHSTRLIPGLNIPTGLL